MDSRSLLKACWDKLRGNDNFLIQLGLFPQPVREITFALIGQGEDI